MNNLLQNTHINNRTILIFLSYNHIEERKINDITVIWHPINWQNTHINNRTILIFLSSHPILERKINDMTVIWHPINNLTILIFLSSHHIEERKINDMTSYKLTKYSHKPYWRDTKTIAQLHPYQLQCSKYSKGGYETIVCIS